MKKILNIIGWFITIICFIFIYRTIIQYNVDFSTILNPKIVFFIILLSILFSFSVFIDSIAWNLVLNLISSKKISFLETFKIFANANIAKYLPGNIGHYAGRNILGVKYNLSQKNILFATLFEIILKVISAILLSLFLAQNQLFIYFENITQLDFINTRFLKIILFCIVFLFIGIVIYYLSPLINKNFNLSHINFLQKLKILFLELILISIVLLLHVLIFLIITYLFATKPLMFPDILQIGSIYIFSWLIGYITIGAPGGIGIKESLLILLLSDMFTIELISIISIITRLITIGLDIVAFLSTKFIKSPIGENYENTK